MFQLRGADISMKVSRKINSACVSLAAATFLTLSVGFRAGVIYNQDTYCQRSKLNLLTCGLASGQMPLQTHSFNTPVSTASGTMQQTIAYSPNIEGVEMLIAVPNNLKQFPDSPQYLASTPQKANA